MKRSIVLIISIIATVIVGSIVYVIVNSSQPQSITFQFDPQIDSVTIGNDNDTAIAKVKNNQTVELQKGDYTYTPTGTYIDTKKTAFSVESSASTIVVPVTYTAAHLDTLAKEAEMAIAKQLTATYPAQMKGYEITNLTIFSDGKWGGVVLTPVGMDITAPVNYYRILIQPSGDSWKLNGKPQSILTIHTNQGVSSSILKKVNDLSPVSS